MLTMDILNPIWFFLFRLVNACTYSAKMKLYDVKTSAANVLEADFTEVYVASYFFWLLYILIAVYLHFMQKNCEGYHVC